MMTRTEDMESMIERVVHDQLGDDYANHLLNLQDRAARLDEAKQLLHEAFAFTLDEAPPPFRTKLSTRIQRFLDGLGDT